jgi:hypothetical protein
MAIIPAVTNWDVGVNPTSAILNARIRDPVNFLKSPPMGIFRKSAAQSVSSSTWTAISWDVEDLDSDASHSTVTNTSRYTAQTAGWYLVQTTLCWASNSTGYRKARFRVNGDDALVYSENTILSSGTGFSADLSTQAHVYLAVNDYVEVQGWQSSGGALNNVIEHLDSRFEVRWLGILNTGVAWDLPVPKTWAAGLWSAGEANVHIRDVYAQLLDPPMAVITMNDGEVTPNYGAFSLSPNSIRWDRAEHDTHGGWSSSQPDRYFAPRTGWYHTICQIIWSEGPNNYGSDRRAYITVNAEKTASGLISEHGVLFSPTGPNGAVSSYTFGGHVFLTASQFVLPLVNAGGLGDDAPSKIVPTCRWTVRWVSA